MITKKNSLISLDIIELLKGLKQFIRVLQFIKKNHGCLYINIENKQQSFLLKQFLAENKLEINIKINSLSSLDTTNSLLFKNKACLILGSDSFMNKEQLFKKINIEKLFLFSKINTNIERNNFGIYKIFNDFFDFKKIVFLLLLINKVLKKKDIIK